MERNDTFEDSDGNIHTKDASGAPDLWIGAKFEEVSIKFMPDGSIEILPSFKQISVILFKGMDASWNRIDMTEEGERFRTDKTSEIVMVPTRLIEPGNIVQVVTHDAGDMGCSVRRYLVGKDCFISRFLQS